MSPTTRLRDGGNESTHQNFLTFKQYHNESTHSPTRTRVHEYACNAKNDTKEEKSTLIGAHIYKRQANDYNTALRYGAG